MRWADTKPGPVGGLDLETSLPGIAWPACPSPRGAQVVSLLWQLDRSQWWTPEALAELQWRQLGEVVAHARATVPVYSDRLAGVGHEASDSSGPIDPTTWDSVPVLTRAEAQENQDSLVSTAPPPSHGETFERATSGSSGRPLRTRGSQFSHMMWCALTLRDHLWHRRDFSASLAVIRQAAGPTDGHSDGSTAENWGAATAGVVRTGPLALLPIDRTIPEQFEWLERVCPGYLLSYPSNLVALAEYALEGGRKLPGLLGVRSFGEVVDERIRTTCEAAWGVPFVDVYSSQEAGYVALQCPESGQYHVQSEAVMVEVVDEHGRACPPGATGRVIVSTLHNFAVPLLRYDIGDYATVGEACPCGRGLPALTRVLGRARNMFVRPDGQRVWPNPGDASRYRAATAGLPRVLQFQVVQRRVDHLEVILVPETPFTPFDEAAYAEFLRTALGFSFDVTFTYVDAIARSAGGKYEDFRSEVG